MFSLGDGFHIYEVEWDSSKVVGRINGKEVGTITIQPDTMDEFLQTAVEQIEQQD